VTDVAVGYGVQTAKADETLLDARAAMGLIYDG
jgi:hypothetical protein